MPHVVPITSVEFQHHNLLNIYHINPSKFPIHRTYCPTEQIDFLKIYLGPDLRLIHDDLFDLNSPLIAVPV